MKKIILGVAIVLMAAVAANAQDELLAAPKRHAAVYHQEFFASTGICAIHNLSSIPEQLASTMTFGAFEPIESNLRFKPSAAVGYKYRFEKVVSLGATLSYSGNTADSELMRKDQKWHLNRDYYALSAEIEFRYLTREHVTLYSTVGVGAAYQHTLRTADTGKSDISRKTIFTAHISEFGVKVGGHRFGGVFECGFGYKGVVNLGTYARF